MRAKTVFDLVVSSFGLVLLSPLFLAIACLVRLESRGPVIYRQERVGLDGSTFTMYKFRSMRESAETGRGPMWAPAGDSRRTVVGAFLRKTHLDELPQLVNIIRGEMSLVGPRPERPHFVRNFESNVPRYSERHRMRGGITGLAQVRGLKYLMVEETTDLDNKYIDNWSFLLDLKILLLTPLELLRLRSH